MKKPNRGTSRGFTMVELILVMVIAGVLAAVAIPRLVGRSNFDARGFTDELAASVRFAQKLSIAQRREVFVQFTTTDATLCYVVAAPCVALVDQAPGPGGEKPYTVTAPDGLTIASPAASLRFDASGRTPDLVAQLVIPVNGVGAYQVLVERETGYVHE